MRAYVLAFTREQLFSVFPKGYPAFDDPGAALAAARATGAEWIIMWCRGYIPMVSHGKTTIELDGCRARQYMRTDNTMIVSNSLGDSLRAIDPELSPKSYGVQQRMLHFP